MAFTNNKNNFLNMDTIGFSTLKIGPWVHFKVLLGFISMWVVVQLRVYHGSFDGASIEPWCTLNWTTTDFEMNPDAIWNEPKGPIFKIEKIQKKSMF